MTRKTKSGAPDKRHGGYRHGIPGSAPAPVQVRLSIDTRDRWRSASIKAGFHETRGMSPFIVEAVEAYIKARKLEE